jgi:hypothetical protein
MKTGLLFLATSEQLNTALHTLLDKREKGKAKHEKNSTEN